ncbi:hypothetical protein Golax_025476, partial [Gossypium laxum]|nr:hypothetical protein [Gossypium laxum]
NPIPKSQLYLSSKKNDGSWKTRENVFSRNELRIINCKCKVYIYSASPTSSEALNLLWILAVQHILTLAAHFSCIYFYRSSKKRSRSCSSAPQAGGALPIIGHIHHFGGGWLKEHKQKRLMCGGVIEEQDFMDVMLNILEDANITGFDAGTINKVPCLEVVNAEIEPPLLRSNLTLAQMKQHNEECAKKHNV